jgi:hypothetical protein
MSDSEDGQLPDTPARSPEVMLHPEGSSTFDSAERAVVFEAIRLEKAGEGECLTIKGG